MAGGAAAAGQSAFGCSIAGDAAASQPFHVNIFLAAAAGEASSFVCWRGSSVGQNPESKALVGARILDTQRILILFSGLVGTLMKGSIERLPTLEI